jgi:hypothetical protein
MFKFKKKRKVEKRKLEDIDNIAISLNRFYVGTINICELYHELMKLQRKCDNVVDFENELKLLAKPMDMYLLMTYQNTNPLY